MSEFLRNNQEDLTARCREKVAMRPGRSASKEQLANGVPMFLDQLIRTLSIEQSSRPMESRRISGPASGVHAISEMGTTAAQHGKALLALGFTVGQVVHDYGDLCQAITDLAIERDAPFEIEEFQTLNRCLDNAIADAVTEFSYQRDFVNADKQASDANERLGFLVHEIRNLLGTISLAFIAAKTGNLSLTGATGSILEGNIINLSTFIDASLIEIKEIGNHSTILRTFSLLNFIAEAKAAAQLDADARGCVLLVASVDPELAISGSRDALLSALMNLLQNAFKFSKPQTEVTLTAYASSDRVMIEVRDGCGGLSKGAEHSLFLPFSQGGVNRTGLGLGLAISKEIVESNEGTISARDLPGEGCIFTINLPRRIIPT